MSNLYGKFIPDYTHPICSTFGCCNYLTLTEQLCGSKCLACMNIKPINIDLIIGSDNKDLTRLIFNNK